jgi:hypothetical protein
MMRKLNFVLTAAAAVTLSATPLSAQWGIFGGSNSQTVPNGMCRVWIDGLPTSQQPRPTDCRTAERQRPYYEQRYGRSARVLYGRNSGNVYGRNGSVYDRNGSVYDRNGNNCRTVERVIMGRVVRQNVCDNNGGVYDRNGSVYDRNGRVYDRNGNVIYGRSGVYGRNGVYRRDNDRDNEARKERKRWEKQREKWEKEQRKAEKHRGKHGW